MNSSFNPKTPRLVGGTVVGAIIVIGFYTFILGPESNPSSSGTITEVPETPAIVSVSTSPIIATPAFTPAATIAATPFSTPAATMAVTPIPAASHSPSPRATPLATALATPKPYKDGTYKVTIDYSVPHGQNSLTAQVTLAKGVILKVASSDNYADGESGRYIGSFESSLQGAVVGKALNEASLSRLGGASLTSKAFNQALTQIGALART